MRVANRRSPKLTSTTGPVSETTPGDVWQEGEDMPYKFPYHVRTVLGLCMLSAIIVSGPPSGVAQPRTTPRVLSLDKAIAMAIQHSPQIKEEQFGVLMRQSQQTRANAAHFAQFEITIVGGPKPRARGNQLSLPDSKGDPDITGVFGRAVFSIIQPSPYTFGKIQAVYDHNVGMAKLEHTAGHDVAAVQALLPTAPGRR